MKTRLRSSFTISACTLLLLNMALAQEASKHDGSETVTIVTAGDISVTRAADGKTAVSINFVPGRAQINDTRLMISGPYTLDVNGGVKEVKGPQGIELHVLSHEELRFEAPEVSLWEQSHKFTQNSACMKIPKFPGCGNPVCEQPDHPDDQCRYNSDSGLLVRDPRRWPMLGEGESSAVEEIKTGASIRDHQHAPQCCFTWAVGSQSLLAVLRPFSRWNRGCIPSSPRRERRSWCRDSSRTLFHPRPR